MDNVNAKMTSSFASEISLLAGDKAAQNRLSVGFTASPSAFTNSDHGFVAQQIKQSDNIIAEASKRVVAEQQSDKAISKSADNLSHEVSQNFADSLNQLNDMMQTNGTNLSFSINEETKQPIVTVTDKESGDVIRQIPSEEMQEFSARVRQMSETQFSLGIVVDRRA